MDVLVRLSRHSLSLLILVIDTARRDGARLFFSIPTYLHPSYFDFINQTRTQWQLQLFKPTNRP